MNKKQNTPWKTWTAVLVLLLVGLVAWHFVHTFGRSTLVTAKAQPTVVAPIHEIPAVAVKNMENAEAQREQKLNGLTLAKSAVVYARVVDQSGTPIPDAKVVISPATGSGAASQNVEQTSDPFGTVTFIKKWPVLSITVTKPGYQNLLASSATFQYAKTAFTPPPHSDPSDPVIFILQRM